MCQVMAGTSVRSSLAIRERFSVTPSYSDALYWGEFLETMHAGAPYGRDNRNTLYWEINMRHQYRMLGRTIALALAGAMILSVASQPAFAKAKQENQKIAKADFNNAMRKLWEDHITWTRLYIISAAGNLPDKDATAQRLLQNQADIGNAVAQFYGAPAGEKLTGLLKDHILGAAALIEAAKTGDKPKIDAAAAKWYANADEIAAFLSGANPQNWPLADMKSGMKMHLNLTLQEATNRLQGKYADDIKDYDKIHQHILGLADLLSSGIEKQFPKKFAKS
jgi:hypothetical protein